MNLQTADTHLAEFNFGTLLHGWDDPRSRDFVDGLDLVNAVAARSPGFVWRLSDDAMEVAQTDPKGPFGDNPWIAATLSVWEDGESLDRFVWSTVHRQYYKRRAEWYDSVGNSHLVMWFVPKGHRPSVGEGMERFRHREALGDSDHAFGWSWLKDAKLWRERQCSPIAAD